MKTKYFFIYVFVGIAFLAVSAWVFFSRGKNAKALRAKYKLGGILLTCWAMLSVASCRGIIDPWVTCYDPAPDYRFIPSTETRDENWGYILSPGAVLTVDVECSRYSKFGIVIRKFEDTKEGDVLQSAIFESDGKNQFKYTLVYDPADKAYTGLALVKFYGYPEGNEDGYELDATLLLITTGAD